MSLYIQDEYSQQEIEDVIQPELRQKAIHAVKNYFDFANNLQVKTHPSTSSKDSKKQHAYIQSLQNAAQDIMEEILTQKNVLINLVDIKSMDNYTYAHCVNVAILSLAVGMELGFHKKQLLDLAVGAMLHDIGKIFVPKEILNKKGKLNDKEYKIIQQHPQRGYDYLKEMYSINAFARIVVLQHQEKVDGSGYPDGLKAEKIHIYSKIVSIADVYDALTSDRPYRRGYSPNEAIEYLMGSVGKSFDYYMVKTFSKKIIPYPIGTLVRLSNGCIASIEAITHSFPLRPLVKIVRGNGEYLSEDIIDLYENHNIVIQGVQYEDPYSDKEQKVSGS